VKTSGIFRLHQYAVECQYGKPIHLVIFGDVHRDSPNHAESKWQEFLAYSRKLKSALFLGMGDYVDSASSSERACFERCGDDLHESTKKDLQMLAAEKVRLIARELAFARGKIIGMLNGNHYFSFTDGTNTDQKICGELGCFYLGVSCFVRLLFNDGNNHGTSLDLWAHHGTGAGRLLGGSINRVDQMREHAEADVYIMGHDHKRAAVPATPRLSLTSDRRDGLSLKTRQQWLVRSGSFLASYRDGESNYNVDAGRGPCSLGHVELIITPRRESTGAKDFTRLDIQALV
jgi:predicted phosphodiesterase